MRGPGRGARGTIPYVPDPSTSRLSERAYALKDSNPNWTTANSEGEVAAVQIELSPRNGDASITANTCLALVPVSPGEAKQPW